MQKSIIYLTDRIIKWLPSALAIAAELSLGSCSQEYQGEGPSGVITFDAYLRGNSTTRASVIDVEKLKLTGYGVFAFDTGQQGFNPEAAGGHVPNFMYNQLVEWLSSADSPLMARGPIPPKRAGQGITFHSSLTHHTPVHSGKHSASPLFPARRRQAIRSSHSR